MSSPGRQEQVSITIERLNSVYLVPRDHPSPDALRACVDEMVSNKLAECCRRVMAQAIDASDPSVWFIRWLDVGFTSDVSAIHDGRFADALGTEIGKTVVATFARGADGESVLRFPDRPAYLAQFVEDIATGHAWDKWYYDNSLRTLSASQAIAQALVREPEAAAETLSRLAANGSLDKIVAALNDRDARLIYCACFGTQTAPATMSFATADAVLAAWPAAFPERLSSTASARSLRLLAAVRKLHPGLAVNGELRDAIDNLLSFAQLLSRVANSELLALKVAAGDLYGAVEMARASGADHFADCIPRVEQVAGNNVVWMTKLAATISPPAPTQAETRNSITGSNRNFISPFGGIFLLLPSYLEQDLEEITTAAPYPDFPNADKSSLLRAIVLAKLFGADRAADVLSDPALLLAVGSKQAVARESLKWLSEHASQEANQECMHRLMQAMWQKGYATGRYLSLELIAVNKLGKVLLLRDLENDVWLWAIPWQDEVSETRALFRQAIKWIPQIAERPAWLLIDSKLSSFMDTETLSAWSGSILCCEPSLQTGLQLVPVNTGSTGQEFWAAESIDISDPEVSTVLRLFAAAKSPAADLAYLSLSVPGGSPVSILPNFEFDLVWSLIARAVLRAFARRLMGFGKSGARYLRDNFLSGMSSVEAQADNIAVELPSCPLFVVLSMAGVNGQTYTIPWLNGIQVKLSLPSS